METKLRLPKEFAEKWIAALESGKYKQGESYLKEEGCDGQTLYCCLGVAAELIENKPESIEGASFIGIDDYDSYTLEQWKEAGYPKELVYYVNNSPIPGLLSNLNDGTSLSSLEKKYKGIYKDVKLPNEVLGSIDSPAFVFQLSFKQIAQFIKDNFEFY